MIVMGFDPGAHTGWCVVDCSAPSAPTLLDYGVAEGGELPPIPAHVRLVAIETVVAVYSRDRFGAGMATALVNAARIEGRILAAAAMVGVRVLQCAAGDWRKALTGKRTATDAQIKAALSMRMKLPRCSAHVRDAVGEALYAAQRTRLDAMRAGKVA